MERHWIIKKKAKAKDIKHLSEALNVDNVIANLLVQRGIKSYDEAKEYFRPQLSSLHDPFLMKDMKLAIERIEAAIQNNENILIYGDYDVDGTTSVAMVYSFLRKIYKNLDYYIPDRFSEGYGISYKGIDFASENNYSLIIALDCGIKAVDKIDYANDKNIDFIICDHHKPGEKIPKAVAVLDPKQSKCNYPFKELSGCGVGFKLLHAYSQNNDIPFEELATYLDLVAVSIASDIVPIVGENRVLAYYGLKQLNTNPRTGLRAIIKIAGIEDKEIVINDLVFKIGPRINAAGRIESGIKAVDLLSTDDEKIALEIGEKINSYNINRKDIDESITQEALKIISEDEALKNKKTTVLYNPGWHKGVIGIVASRLIRNYYRPTIILTESNGLATGSARSVSEFDVYKAISECSDLLENFGGHTYAAGVTLKIENIPAFQEKFEKVVSKTIKPDQLIPKINVDAKINLKDINPKFCRILKQFQPFGPENMKHVFVTENVADYGYGRIVGRTNEHLKLDLMEKDKSNVYYSAIAFQQAQHFDSIKDKLPFDVCYSIEENVFNGKTSLQLKVKDIKTR